MKTIFVLSAVVSLLTFASCGDSSSPSGPPPVVIGGGGVTQRQPTEDSASNAPSVAFPSDGEQSARRNFYFVFDGSGSMAGKLDAAKRAVNSFMKSVPNDVNLGLYVFDEGGSREAVSLGPNNREAFLKMVNRVEAGGGTPLGASMFTGCNALLGQYKKQLGYGEYRLIVVTDGEPSDGNEFNKACEYARQAKVPIYAIGYNVPGGNHPLRDPRYTVSYREATDEKSLQRGLEEVTAETETYDAQSFDELFKLMGDEKK